MYFKKLLGIPKLLTSRLQYWRLNDYPLWRARLECPIQYLASWFARSEGGPTLEDVAVKVFCQVKDDSDIVEDWLRWHGYLFGFHNLVVIADRPSPATVEVLDRYSGQVVILQAPLGVWPSDLGWDDRRTCNINHAIKVYANEADFVFPLDIDEFVIFEDKPSKRCILSELKRLKRTHRDGFKFAREFQSCTLERPARPALDIRTFRNAHANFDLRKCFASPQHLSWVGSGQCYVHTSDQLPPLVSRLSLLHFRWRGLDHMYQKCMDHVSQEILLSDGTSRIPRVGGHVLQGAQSIESGSFQAWARKEVGEANKTIHSLAEHLSSLS
ncbi:glycosyltransferase family 2 protein [Synechococcus sp. 1G10]|uniref:glycosyltransferase family 2 protein n=1 Tax=Synechococcus sp. 1G10 TaxID=2025605 RepID=UPI00130389E9|nr:glycosyltransferase family 2 protein [Synechococcus sp. 1G10]